MYLILYGTISVTVHRYLRFLHLSPLNDSLPNEMLQLSEEYTLIQNYRKWQEENSMEIKKGGGVAI